jgi:hypothetical protein
LAVSTQVFVAEAFGDLVVVVKTRHHQQLLEQLRAFVAARKNMPSLTRLGVVTRAFGCVWSASAFQQCR